MKAASRIVLVGTLCMLAATRRADAQLPAPPFLDLSFASDGRTASACENKATPIPVRFVWTSPDRRTGPTVGWVIHTKGTAWVLVETLAIPPRQNFLDVRGRASCTTILFMALGGPERYAVHGPFVWPAHPVSVEVRLAPRRTIWGNAGSDYPHPVPVWLSDPATTFDPGWPICRTLASRWECVGVPAEAGGVVLLDTVRNPIIFAIVPAATAALPAGPVPVLRAGYGRLVVARCHERACESRALQAEGVQLQPPRRWPRSARWQRVSTINIDAAPVGVSAVWVSGNAGDEEPHTYVSLRRQGSATVLVPMSHIREGPVESPLVIVMGQERPLHGTVSARHTPVYGASLTAFAAVPGHHAENPSPMYPAAVAETDAEGAFALHGLDATDYELGTFHPQAGRAVRRVRADDTRIDIELTAGKQVTGTVTRGGVPAAAVAVQVVPDLNAALDAEDPSLLVGGSGRSGPDGRFVLPLPLAGHSELRVGGEASDPITRVRLGDVADLPAQVDVGVVALGTYRRIAVVIDAPAACRLHAVGPLTGGGFSLIEADIDGPTLRHLNLPEAGRWALSLSCGARELTLEPAIVHIEPARWEQTVQVHVRLR